MSGSGNNASLAGYRWGITAAIFSSFLSSIGWITQREAALALSPLTTTFGGPALSVIIVGLFLFFRGEFPNRLKLRSVWRPILLKALLGGVVGGLFCSYASFYSSSAKLVFLTKIEPYIIVFWHWLCFNERLSRYQLGLLGVHIAGAILLSTGGQFHFDLDQLGDLFLLVGVLMSAITYRPAQQVVRELGPIAATWITQLVAAIVLFFPWAFSGFVGLSLSPEHLSGWGYMASTVVLFFVLAMNLWFYSVTHLPSWLASALRCIGPLGAAPIAWYFFDQMLGRWQAYGAGIVIVTSLMMILEKRQPASLKG